MRIPSLSSLLATATFALSLTLAFGSVSPVSASPAQTAAFIHYPDGRTFAAWFDEETGHITYIGDGPVHPAILVWARRFGPTIDSAAFSLVPKPVGWVPGWSYIAKSALSVVAYITGVSSDRVYKTCVTAAALNWRSAIERASAGI